jgi:hypothetical protein
MDGSVLLSGLISNLVWFLWFDFFGLVSLVWFPGAVRRSFSRRAQGAALTALEHAPAQAARRGGGRRVGRGR